MSRIARLVLPDMPHHITQRGNRRLPTFFSSADYEAYLELMAERCAAFGIAIWAYCLMPNHTHLIAVPATEDGLARGIGDAHRRYSRQINAREGWRGFLWQGRFSSCILDETHLLAATRYIELNPVRAGLVDNPLDYPWSSARAHHNGEDDVLVQVAPMLERVKEKWARFLKAGLSNAECERLRLHERTGRPIGNDSFLDRLEARLGTTVRPQPPGRKPLARTPAAKARAAGSGSKSRRRKG